MRYVTLGVTVMMVTLIIDTIDWSVTGVCYLLLGSHLSHCDMLVNCTMTCESIDIIILLLELLILDI